MGFTFAEKALARAAGLPQAVAGQIVDAHPDVALSHDNTAPIARTFREIGARRVRFPERLAITLDHAVPAPTTQHAQNHAEIRRFVADQGIAHFFEAGRGICHQVISEEALVWPGQLILGSDSHTTHFGWLGAFGAGVGRSEMAAIWATGELWLRVPETIRIDLIGALPPGVTAKDLSLWVLRQLGPDAGIYTALEFGGPGLASLSLESRMVIPNMMAEAGAKNAYLEPDDAVFDWLAQRLAARASVARRASKRPAQQMQAGSSRQKTPTILYQPVSTGFHLLQTAVSTAGPLTTRHPISTAGPSPHSSPPARSIPTPTRRTRRVTPSTWPRSNRWSPDRTTRPTSCRCRK